MRNIILIDPRPASKDAMVAILKQNAPVVGIEFTLPALSQYIVDNVDGQHYGAANLAAIEIAQTYTLPEEASLAIVRADADALGAVALFNLREYGVEITPGMAERIERIALNDKFARGPWPGPRPLSIEPVEAQFKGLGVLASNHKMSIQERVQLFEQFLVSGDCDGLNVARQQAVDSIHKAATESNVEVDGNMAVVESRHIGATEVGYHFAPIVIIRNDAFRFPNVGGTHLKYTVCQYQAGYVDLKSACAQLNDAEQSGGSWGGSPTIVGSPQGVSSSLDLNAVVQIVKQNLL